mgnify:FL=1
MPPRSEHPVAFRGRAPLLLMPSLAVLWLFAATPAEPRSARVTSFTESRALPVTRPDTPVPDDPGQVLYLQRSTNRNTVVYAARFDAAGQLDPHEPVAVYWRRYEEQGQARGLNLLERQLAYGLRTRPGTEAGTYRVSFRAAPDLEMTLRQNAPFQAALYAAHADQSIRLRYGYIQAIDGLIPQVTELRFFGLLPGGRYATIVLVPD